MEREDGNWNIGNQLKRSRDDNLRETGRQELDG